MQHKKLPLLYDECVSKNYHRLAVTNKEAMKQPR